MRRRGMLALPLLGGCRGTDVATALTPLGDATERLELPFGTLPRQRLDLTLPATSPLALLVFFYGGGFTSGDRGDYRFVSRVLAASGYAVAVPDYRVWPAARWPDFLDDAAGAVAWLRSDAGRAAGAPDAPIVLVGHSAGAFLALALALDLRWLGEGRAMLAGAIGLAGVYDWQPRDEPLRTIFAAAPGGVIRAAPATAPLATAPPLLLLHGEADTTVRPEQSRRVAASVGAAGGRATLRTYPGVAHVGILSAIAAPVRSLGLNGAPVLEDIVEFVTAVCAPREPMPALVR